MKIDIFHEHILSLNSKEIKLLIKLMLKSLKESIDVSFVKY